MPTGYACPVCDDPQADAGHLANHLAFTAMLREDGHAAWLDEHVPDWDDRGEDELAAALRDRDDLEEREFPQVFEDTTDDEGSVGRDDPAERSGALFDDEGGHAHAHDHGAGRPADLPDGVDSAAIPGGELDEEEHEAIMDEARELTRQLRENAAAADAEGGEPTGDASDGGTGETDDEA